MRDVDKFSPNFGRNAVIAAALIAGLLCVLAFVQGAEDNTEQTIASANK